ncbi:DUF418 domain-containing protein, partial [Halorhodospira halophila]|uniref:DUF418 domain-containing protein n=1 Tax=Halorhodospira halophila TaxID=1053 RepID=UPI00190584C3
MGSGQRLESLDAVRGAAVLGILVINIQLFAMPVAGLLSPTLLGGFEGWDYVVWAIGHVFFEGKFIALFAALFGAGAVLLAERHRAAGINPWVVHRRRMLALGAIGLAHGTLLWMGDILFIYAAMGLLAFLFIDRTPRALLAWGAALYALPILLTMAAGWGLTLLPTAGFIKLASASPPVHEEITAAIEAYQGGWLTQMEQRLPEALTRYLVGTPARLGWLTLGCMLIGMAAYKNGFLTGAWSSRAYARVVGYGLGIGVPMSIVGIAYREWRDWELLSGFFFSTQLNQLAVPFVAAGWAALIILAFQRGWLGRLHWPLTAVGRTALSGYLLQSVLCTLVFYGHGLGLYGEMGRPTQLLVVLGVWLVLLIAAPLWLRAFRMGPAEWLLRQATQLPRPAPCATRASSIYPRASTSPPCASTGRSISPT